MKRSLLSLSPLISSTNVCFRTHLLAGLKPRLCLSARPSSFSTVPLTRTLHDFRTPPSTLREQSILQFLSSRLAQATHRSGIRRGRAGGSYGGGPEGPWQRLRARINAIPSNYIFWGIIGLNGLVFVSWNLAWAKYQSTGDASSYLWLRRNFTSSAENMQGGRWWTVVTSCFSHESSMHILFNGFTYYFMAPLVLSILGNVGFLGLYLGGGITSSFAGIAWRNYNSPYPGPAGSHGASGAIYSVISFFACVAPTATFALFGIIPLPAWAFVTGIFLYDGYSAVNSKRVATDTAGHIGGLLAGIGYFIAKRFRVF
ncbi:uncharacterized protein TRAVEDRAFT_163861 [Trametes versicolor FP-101664 SS1]|uniref:uncharacterized protein n=1 Tax=Trametes versicolor (strain FP-101664) TaxID=717944 RepID=UPI0004622466|nr:uncharacterized protein TRAVEDRAFT_163861 [Trametes versicolor FP-101664 SS1]EIW62087.1 hypothetical protein TRAVEDRAFT_163861 [Trametes versicolor FP-101664 SS1]